VRGGHSIGQVARLDESQLRDLIPAPASSPGKSLDSADVEQLRSSILQAVESFAAPVLDTILNQALLSLGQQGLIRLVVAPLAQEVGDLWRSGKFTSGHEHFFTATVKIFLREHSRQFSASENAPCLIVATPAGQLHELGAVLVAAEAANVGWRVVYLGTSLPAAEIAGAAARKSARAVALSIIYPEDDPDLPNELEQLAELLKPRSRLVVGGRAAMAYLPTLLRIGATFADRLEEFSAYLDRWRRPAREKAR
jgi:methanogenic corrinoid protein MtbC1